MLKKNKKSTNELKIKYDNILEVSDLSISFTQYTKGLKRQEIQIIQDLNLTIGKNETVAIFGASGSGKSLLAHAILGLLPTNANIDGSIKYKGEELTPKRLEKLRGNGITFIPQTVNSLNPLLKVKNHFEFSENLDKNKLISTLKLFGLDESVLELYPHELSGGMARRVMVTIGFLEPNCSLLIADEPTPGMDKSSLDETLSLLSKLKKDGKSILIISHDIDTILNVADRIGIFYNGTIIEYAKPCAFKNSGKGLLHPYSKALINALPSNGFKMPENPNTKEGVS